MRLWLDDVRPAPAGWERVETVAEAIARLATGRVTHVSLDYHLHGREKGHEVAAWIREAAWEGRLPRLDWKTHTADPTGAAYMARLLEEAELFWDEREAEGA